MKRKRTSVFRGGRRTGAGRPWTRSRKAGRVRGEQEDLKRALEIEKALYSLLAISLKDASLETLLQFFLDLLLDMSWLRTLPRGGIFLVEGDKNVLKLKVLRNLDPEVIKNCDRVPFGRCLCGRAAASRQILYSAEVKEKHEVKYTGQTTPRPLYCSHITG